MRTINIDTIRSNLYRTSNLEWIGHISGSVPGEILIYLDLFFLFAVDAPSVRASIFSRSRLFSLSLSLSMRERARVRSHINIQTRCDEDERMWASISFYFKTWETLKRKDSLHLRFSLSSSSSSRSRHVQNGQIATSLNQNENFIANVKGKKRQSSNGFFLFLPFVSIKYIIFHSQITFSFFLWWNQIVHVSWVRTTKSDWYCEKNMTKFLLLFFFL